jgi:hypothetical protein
VFSNFFYKRKTFSHLPSTHLVSARELQGKETVSADLRVCLLLRESLRVCICGRVERDQGVDHFVAHKQARGDT